MPPTDRFSDSAIAAQACRELFDGKFCHVPGLGWLSYDGRRWADCPAAVVLEALRLWSARKLGEAASAYAAGTGVQEHVKGWAGWQALTRLQAALTLARGIVHVPADKLDSKPDVLNCHNGVVYLPTGDLIPHSPDQYLTKLAGADYVPTALHVDWNRALGALPTEVQTWVQEVYGQACTGHANPEDRVLIQQGGGANGKTTVLTAVGNALGDYYLVASDKILMASHNTAHTTDFTDLRGARFVAIEELPELGRLDAAALKRVCGTERITARRMRQDNFTFTATHTLILNTNYAPAVAETDLGTWRRLLLLVFPYTFMAHPLEGDERQGDPRLRERLAASPDGQKEAVLAWLVEGAQRWYTNGRATSETPALVRETTEEWRGRHDHVARFWGDYLQVDPGSYIYNGDLIWMFNQFMRQHGNAAISDATFNRRFRTHPITAAANLTKRPVRQGSGEHRTRQTPLEISRPYGALDPFSRLPGLPSGQPMCWVGLKFREARDEALTWGDARLSPPDEEEV